MNKEIKNSRSLKKCKTSRKDYLHKKFYPTFCEVDDIKVIDFFIYFYNYHFLIRGND